MPSFIQRTNEEIMQNLLDMRDIMFVEFWSFELGNTLLIEWYIVRFNIKMSLESQIFGN